MFVSISKTRKNVNFSSLTDFKAEQSIISNSIVLSGQTSNSFTMNIGTLAKGYYKVFVKINQHIGIIYINNENQGNNEEQFNKLNSFELNYKNVY
jgi:hypothetical protein